MNLIITDQDIRDIRQLASRQDDSRLNQFMLDAQFIDLQKVLCDTFYFEVTENVSNHEDLMNGSVYEVNGKTRRHEGLKKVTALFAYARIVRFGSAVSTAYDMVNKINDKSQSISENEKQKLYTENRKVAMAYWQGVKTFLDLTDYEGWSKCCEPKTMSGFKLNVITAE